MTYNGAEQTQDVSVTLAGFDPVTYDISGNKQTYANINGKYSLTVTGNGNFTGSRTLDWSIAQAIPVQNSAKMTTAKSFAERTLANAFVTQGEILGIDGTTVLEGTFAWVDSTKVISGETTEQMIFTPEDINYAPITIDVPVSTYSSGSARSTGTKSTESQYTVKFNTNGGNDIASQTVTKNSKVNEPTAPIKDGYTFDGWYTDSGFTTEYDFSSGVTKDITLYAKWTEKATEPETPTEPSNEEWNNPFTDVSEKDWFFESVKYANKNGLMQGTTSTVFSPNEPLTRGMLVCVLYRMEGEPAVEGSIPFTDVDANAYYADAVIWAKQNGIISGVSETEFAPDDNIIREQISAIMFRFAKYKGYDVSVGESTNILSYTDFDEISEYAIPAIQYAVGSGLMFGKTESTINPKDFATRAEIAAILQRFIEGNK